MILIIIRSILRPAAAGLIISSAFLGLGCAGGNASEHPPERGDALIQFHLKRIEADPGHYPSHAMLADAYLEMARETGDLDKIALARKHAEKSLEIQPNIEALKAMAKIEGFGHRFESSLEWARKAAISAADSAPDGEISAIMVDAWLGLGKKEEARRVIDELAEDGFHKQAALGNYYKANAQPAEAERAFMNASEFALRENAGKAQAWAEVMAAGVWIDSGEYHKAVRHLEKAGMIDPDSTSLKVHWAEYREMEGALETAIEIYRSILETSESPEIHHRLFRLYRKMGRNGEAEKEFELARSGFRKILDAGHVFALGPLAQLLCDAGKNPDEARRLSAENLKYKRDAEALATEGCVERMAVSK